MLLEGLGFNLCVVPFLNVCVPNLNKVEGHIEGRVLAEVGGVLVGGVVLELGERGLSWRGSEDEDR